MSTLSDFIRDGCSARPEDKVSALAEVAALEARIEALGKMGQDLLDILAAEIGDVLVSLKVAERVLAFKAALRREEET